MGGARNVAQRVVPKPIAIVDDPVAHLGYKPRHRGRLHQVAFFVSIPTVVLLVSVAARSNGARIASLVYGLSLTGLFFTSSLYNRLAGTTRMRSWMRWLDHSMIYVFIAGSYTPVCWVTLQRHWSIPILAIVWTAALGGVLLKMTSFRRFRRVGGTLYVCIGCFAVLLLPKLYPALTPWARLFLLAGGATYLVGAIVLWVRRPNPTVDFGYHEVWHGFVAIAAALHFAMTWIAMSNSV
jgi:hemolysin III